MCPTEIVFDWGFLNESPAGGAGWGRRGCSLLLCDSGGGGRRGYSLLLCDSGSLEQRTGKVDVWRQRVRKREREEPG